MFHGYLGFIGFTSGLFLDLCYGTWTYHKWLLLPSGESMFGAARKRNWISCLHAKFTNHFYKILVVLNVLTCEFDKQKKVICIYQLLQSNRFLKNTFSLFVFFCIILNTWLFDLTKTKVFKVLFVFFRISVSLLIRTHGTVQILCHHLTIDDGSEGGLNNDKILVRLGIDAGLSNITGFVHTEQA